VPGTGHGRKGLGRSKPSGGRIYDVEVVVVALLALFPLVGAVIGHWWTIGLPLVAWPIWFLGLARDWWGYGLGDGWQYGAVLLTAVSVVSVVIAIVLRSRLTRGRSLTAADRL
jgi:hypothetical protein